MRLFRKAIHAENERAAVPNHPQEELLDRQNILSSYGALNERLGHHDQLYGCLTFAQSGDDLIAAGTFEMLGISRPTYMDIGAHHPINISNTALLYLRGARGINVEANPFLIEPFRQFRPEDINLNVGVSDERGKMTLYMFDRESGLNTFDVERACQVTEDYGYPVKETITIEVRTIADIIGEHHKGVCPDYLTIDVEGMDLRILKSIPYDIYSPKLMCVEANTKKEAFAIYNFLTTKGYKLYYRIRGNYFFIQACYFNDFEGQS